MYASPWLEPSHPNVQPILQSAEITIKLTPFDRKEYRALIDAREQTLRRIVKKLKPSLELSRAVDVGCGVGFFSQTLSEFGLQVCGFDARAENVTEARRRFPGIPFKQADIEDRGVSELGQFDFVLCFGLLYHLENPLQAIRNLRAITEKCLLLESMCLPEESSQVKMLYRAGFAKVYRVTPLPDHDDFRETREHAQRRTVLLASLMPIEVAGFRLVLEPQEAKDPWAKIPEKATLPRRIRRFLTSPMRKKYITLANRVKRIYPSMPIPLRLPFGAWWLARDSALDHQLIHHEFENMEMRFVKRLLRRDMTVVDVGAHHGIYTLLASKCVGWNGRIVAIEPSPPGMLAAGKTSETQPLFECGIGAVRSRERSGRSRSSCRGGTQ